MKGTDKQLRCEEGYVNAFTSIIHAILFCVECGLGCVKYVKSALKCELLHAVCHAIKLSKITGISLVDIINDTTKFGPWTQHAALYEYIYMRILILLNFRTLCENDEIISKMLSNTDPNWTSDDILFFDAFTKNIHTPKISRHVCDFMEQININVDDAEFLNNKDALCGSMIMQYFMFDPMMLGKNQAWLLKGGTITDASLNNRTYKVLYNHAKTAYITLMK